jgi:O-antigen/teichoic acid export membrane protein
VQIWAGLGVAVLIKDALKIISEPEYHSAYMYVPVLILGHYFYGSFAYLQFGPFLKKKTKYLGGLAVVLAGVNVGLNLLLIPVLGIWGATLTTLVSYFLMVALLYPIAQKLYYIPFQFGRLLKLLGTAAALYFIAHFINPPSLTLALIIKFLIGLSYPLVLYVLRFYTAQERSKLKDIASSVFCTTKKRLFGVRNDSCMKEPEDKPV